MSRICLHKPTAEDYDSPGNVGAEANVMMTQFDELPEGWFTAGDIAAYAALYEQQQSTSGAV
jgi:hypothetical protein